MKIFDCRLSISGFHRSVILTRDLSRSLATTSKIGAIGKSGIKNRQCFSLTPLKPYGHTFAYRYLLSRDKVIAPVRDRKATRFG